MGKCYNEFDGLPDFVCFVLSGECLQDYWSSGFMYMHNMTQLI